MVMEPLGAMIIDDEKGGEKERHAVVYGAGSRSRTARTCGQRQLLVEWDPYSFTIMTEDEGQATFKDVLDGQTVHEQVDENTGMSALVIIESPDEKKQPRIEVRDQKGKVVRKYLLPSGAHLMVEDGQAIFAGDVLAKIPRETAKTKDITGGLPRVVELFEARRPKEPAVISEIDGSVKYGDVQKQYRKIFVTGDDGETREYQLPRGSHINVQEGERVKAGEPLMDGPIDPHDILRVRGEKELQRYLVDEIQEVYRLQGVNINDKHIEVISRQMMRWVKVEEVGDSEFLIDEIVDRFRFMLQNNRLAADGKKPAQRAPAAPRHHEGLALDRLVHLGGELPGDDPRSDRGRHQRQGGPPPRPQGERHHGPADPRRHRHGVLPPDQDPRRSSSVSEARLEGEYAPSTWSSPSTSARAWPRRRSIAARPWAEGAFRGLPRGPPESRRETRAARRVSLRGRVRKRGWGAPLAAAPRARRHADLALERARERGLALVADLERDVDHLRVRVAQQARGELHPPPRQVLHRRLADEVDEALVERRARQARPPRPGARASTPRPASRAGARARGRPPGSRIAASQPVCSGGSEST